VGKDLSIGSPDEQLTFVGGMMGTTSAVGGHTWDRTDKVPHQGRQLFTYADPRRAKVSVLPTFWELA
jgi:hypothetical protein